MKTAEIYYSHKKSIIIEVPRKKKGETSFQESFIRGDYSTWNIKVIKGLDEFISHVVENSNDRSSNKGKWYAHCNGYCLDAIVDYNSRETGFIRINSYYSYRKPIL